MAEVGIRALKQNASAVVARAVAGEVVTITDRGRPVAQLTPIRRSRIEQLVDAGLVEPPTRSLADLPAPEPGPPITPVLQQMRDDERY